MGEGWAWTAAVLDFSKEIDSINTYVQWKMYEWFEISFDRIPVVFHTFDNFKDFEGILAKLWENLFLERMDQKAQG